MVQNPDERDNETLGKSKALKEHAKNARISLELQPLEKCFSATMTARFLAPIHAVLTFTDLKQE